MKNNVKNYLSLSALVTASVFMTSCDGDDVTVNNLTADELGKGIANAQNIDPAPIPFNLYPLTSLKLAFATAGGACLDAAFQPGDEIELDFDTALGSATAGDSVLDITFDSTIIFGIFSEKGFAEGVVSDREMDTFFIDTLYIGAPNNTGAVVLQNVTFTPLASDQRSVTGSFVGSAPVETAFNVTNPDQRVLSLDGFSVEIPGSGGELSNDLIVFEDIAGDPVEVTAVDASATFETRIGTGNYGVSLAVERGRTCTLNFVVAKATIADEIAANDAAGIIAKLNVLNTLNVGPLAPSDEITPNSPARYLIGGTVAGGVIGSYRHDLDSSVGTLESLINSSGGLF